MEELVVKEETPRKRGLNIVTGLFSFLTSLAISGFCFYLSFLKNYWFIALAICFVLEAFFNIVSLFNKDDYKAMRQQGIVQILGVILLMPYLLFMILWNDPDTLMDYRLTTYIVLGVLTLIKIFTALISRLAIKKNYQPLLHAYSNGALIMACYVILIIQLILVNQFDPGESTAVFDNLLKQKRLWIYILDILMNATLTIFAALLALSTEIRAKTKEELTTAGKIKHTIKWFNDNEVSMFFGLIFTLYLAVLSLINMKQSFFYILLFVYYIGTASIRIINYLWHKRIQKKCGDNQIKNNRLSSWILLFNAFTYLFFSNVLVVAAIFMMINKANMGTNIYLFLFLIIPMAIMRFITANKSIKANRKNNNTYRLGVSLIGLVSVFFTILEVVAISCHGIAIEFFRYGFIILAIIAVKIAVIIVAIIFIIHWLRSIILNRKSKERKLADKRQ